MNSEPLVIERSGDTAKTMHHKIETSQLIQPNIRWNSTKNHNTGVLSVWRYILKCKEHDINNITSTFFFTANQTLLQVVWYIRWPDNMVLAANWFLHFSHANTSSGKWQMRTFHLPKTIWVWINKYILI